MPRILEEAIQFAENPEPRCPCLLLVDTSYSMNGEKLEALEKGLETFKFDLQVDPIASRRVEIAIITFNNHISLATDWTAPDDLVIPPLVAQGQTFMGTAINKGLDLLEERKQVYRQNGIAYYRPWIHLLTDGTPEGEPESETQRAIQRVRQAENQKQAAFFAVGVENADMRRLKEISVRQPLKLQGLEFAKMFLWLSRSMQSLANSRPDEQIALQPPQGWAQL